MKLLPFLFETKRLMIRPVVSDGYELSYCFHSDYQGCGYASEAIEALLKHMEKSGNKHIVFGTALNNIPSVNLLKRLGFVQLGMEHVSFYKDKNGKDIYFDGGIFAKELE